MLRHTLEAKRFYKTKAWRECRTSYISTVLGGLCEHCNDKPGYIVDHIIEINIDNINDPEITLNHDNLQYLCTPCHNRKTFTKHQSIRKDVMFNEQGELVKVETD